MNHIASPPCDDNPFALEKGNDAGKEIKNQPSEKKNLHRPSR
jgi:hypothetical protein